MRWNTVLTYGALGGMVLMLILQATSISTDPKFIKWYYLQGGRAQVEGEMMDTLYSMDQPGNLSSLRLLTVEEREEVFKERSYSLYNQFLSEGR